MATCLTASRRLSSLRFVDLSDLFMDLGGETTALMMFKLLSVDMLASNSLRRLLLAGLSFCVFTGDGAFCSAGPSDGLSGLSHNERAKWRRGLWV